MENISIKIDIKRYKKEENIFEIIDSDCYSELEYRFRNFLREDGWIEIFDEEVDSSEDTFEVIVHGKYKHVKQTRNYPGHSGFEVLDYQLLPTQNLKKERGE